MQSDFLNILDQIQLGSWIIENLSNSLDVYT